MGKEISSEKLKDMVESILPSKNRMGARRRKAAINRQRRRAARQNVCDDLTNIDIIAEVTMTFVVDRRRGADKLAHFIRWCHKLTRGMNLQQALSFVRSILPRDVIGDHAYGHWEIERRYDDLFGRTSVREERGRKLQSYVDSAEFRLRRALKFDPLLHARLNNEIRGRKKPEEPRRLLLGLHDVRNFVTAIAPPKFEKHDD